MTDANTSPSAAPGGNQTLSSLARAETSHPILSLYPAFRLLAVVLRSQRDTVLLKANAILALTWLAAFLAGARLDDTLHMPGRAVGLLEHPSTFAFILACGIIPITLPRATALTCNLTGWARDVIRREAVDLNRYVGEYLEFLERRSPTSRATFALMAMLGAVPFLWNSYANQIPYEHAGFDFWDSALHPWGYWLTRAFKLYFWVLFLPSVGHVVVANIAIVRKLLLDSVKNGFIVIDPFHPDQCGGLRRFVDVVLIPLWPAVAVAGGMAFGAVMVHRKLDLTTGGAVALFVGAVIGIYFMPALPLRTVARNEKARQLEDLSRIQHQLYRDVISTTDNTKRESAVAGISAIEAIAKVVRSLPTWPRLHSVARRTALLLSSPLFGLIAGIAVDVVKEYVKQP